MPWPVVLLFPAALVASLAFRAFRSRVKGGRFAVLDNGRTLQTELGRYTFDQAAGKVHLERAEGHRSFIKLRDIRGVQVRVGFKEALLEEVFLEGWNLTDLYADYRDHRLYWDVILNTRHGAVPLAHLSQYKKRDWFDLSTPLQHAVLSLVGLYRDGAVVAAELENATRQALRNAGLNVLGGYESVAPSGALDGAPVPTDADLPPPTTPQSNPPPLAIDLPPPPDNPRWESVTRTR